MTEKQRQWAKDNREHLRAYHKKWRDANSDKTRQYYTNNRKSILARVKKYAERNKENVAEYQREYRKNNIEKIRGIGLKYARANRSKQKDYHLRKKYGITTERYEQMFLAQEGRCAICGVQGEKLGVDHSHSTGAIRSLLCFKCNVALGLFKEDCGRLAKAIVYLEKFGG